MRGVRERDGEDRPAVVVGVDRRRPARSPTRRTSDSPRPRPTGPGGLVVTPGAKTSRSGGRGRRRRPRSSRVSPSSCEGDGHGAVAVGAERVERVVDQVADDRREVGRREAGAQPRAGLDAQRHAALARGRGLAEQQRDEHRLLDPLPQPAEQVLRATRPRCRRARPPPRSGPARRARRSRAGGWRPRGSGRSGHPRAPWSRRARARASRPRSGRAA